jgi:hypothetical protein
MSVSISRLYKHRYQRIDDNCTRIKRANRYRVKIRLARQENSKKNDHANIRIN